MRAELITTTVFDEDNKPHTTFGVRVDGKSYCDLSLNKDLVLRFIEFLNMDEDPTTQIEVLIEDFLS